MFKQSKHLRKHFLQPYEVVSIVGWLNLAEEFTSQVEKARIQGIEVSVFIPNNIDDAHTIPWVRVNGRNAPTHSHRHLVRLGKTVAGQVRERLRCGNLMISVWDRSTNTYVQVSGPDQKPKCWNCDAEKKLEGGLCVKCGRFGIPENEEKNRALAVMNDELSGYLLRHRPEYR